MGRRKSTSRPHKTRRTVEGRCPKCTTIVRFNVSGPVGSEIYECIGCRSKFPIDELWSKQNLDKEPYTDDSLDRNGC